MAGAGTEAQMTDNATLARSLYDAFNARDFDRAAALWADKGVITIVGSGQHFHGPNGSKESLRSGLTRFRTRVSRWTGSWPRTPTSWLSSPAAAPTRARCRPRPARSRPPVGRSPCSSATSWSSGTARLSRQRFYWTAARLWPSSGLTPGRPKPHPAVTHRTSTLTTGPCPSRASRPGGCSLGYQPRARHSCRCGRSAPRVVSAPCPG